MIQIELKQKIKDEMIKIHWSWFWKRMNRKIIHLKNKDVSVYQFFYNELGWDENTCQQIVLGDYSFLRKSIEPTNALFKTYNQKKNCRYELKKYDSKKGIWICPKRGKIRIKLKDVMMKFWGYDDFSNGFDDFNENTEKEEKEWNAYTFVKKLAVDVCPYCNREYIFVIGDIKNRKIRPEIDHFFPKADYPYLSCSLFNFIPSCSICNGRKSSVYNKYKNSSDIDLILYPYNEGFELKESKGKNETHGWFRAVAGRGDIYKSSRVKLVLDGSNPLLYNKMNMSKEAFLLEEFYNCHKTELKDLLARYKKYSTYKVRDILKTLNPNVRKKMNVIKNNLGTLKDKQLLNDFLDECFQGYTKSLRNYILGIPVDFNGTEQKRNYPLQKFKRDIVQQLDDYAKQKK